MAGITEQEVLDYIRLDPGFEFSINMLMAHFRVSNATLYKHLKSLTDSGQINVRQFGQRRLWSVPAPPERFAAFPQAANLTFKPLGQWYMEQQRRIRETIEERKLA